MGRFSVRVKRFRLNDETVRHASQLRLFCVHDNGEASDHSVLRVLKSKGPDKELATDLDEPFVFLDGFCASVLKGQVVGRTLESMYGELEVPLREMPLGVETEVAVAVGTTISLVLSICCLDFGIPKQTSLKRFNWEDVYDGLFARYVVDVELIEARDLSKSGPRKKGDVYCVVLHAKSPVYKTAIISNTLNPSFESQDCTFFLDESDPMLRIMFFEKNLAGRDDVLGGVFVNLKDVCLYKSDSESEEAVPHMWLELTRRNRKEFGPETRSGWVCVKIQINMETDSVEGMLAHLGTPLQVMPFRMTHLDLILMDNHTVGGRLISAATVTKWDHVAIVMPKEGIEGLALMEATRDGVSVCPLEDRVKAILDTGATLGVRRLRNFKRTRAIRDTLADFASEHNGKPYEESISTLIKSKFKSNTEADLSSLFCSELVAAAYQRVLIIQKSHVSSNFSPKDFSLDVVPGLTYGVLDCVKKFSKTHFSASDFERYTSSPSVGHYLKADGLRTALRRISQSSEGVLESDDSGGDLGVGIPIPRSRRSSRNLSNSLGSADSSKSSSTQSSSVPDEGGSAKTSPRLSPRVSPRIGNRSESQPLSSVAVEKSPLAGRAKSKKIERRISMASFYDTE